MTTLTGTTERAIIWLRIEDDHGEVFHHRQVARSTPYTRGLSPGDRVRLLVDDKLTDAEVERVWHVIAGGDR